MIFSQLEIRLIGSLVAVILLFGLGVYLEHRGASACISADKVQVAAQAAHKASVEAVDAVIVTQEKQIYDQAVDRPLVRPISISLCGPTPATLPAAPAPGRKPDAATTSAEVHREPVVPSATLGPGLQRTGQQADAQIAGLQDYINRVCLKR